MKRCITMRIYSTPGSLKKSGQFGIYWKPGKSNTPCHFGMAANISIDDPFYYDRPLVFTVYYKYCFTGLCSICTVSRCISGSSNTPGHYGMAGHVGRAEPLYNDRPIIFVVYCKYAIIALYTISIVCWGMIRCFTMRIYSLSWSLKTSGQFEMAGQMGMEEPFYNDRPMILQDYYKYAIISMYTTSIVYWSIERCITMCIYSISWSLKTSGQFEMAGQMGME